MWSFLVVSCLLTVAYSNVCLWGRTDSVNVGLNGVYVSDVTINGKISYKKTSDASCSLPTVYLFYTNALGYDEWRLSNTNENPNTASFMATCSQSQISACTQGQWQVYANAGWATDSNLYAQIGSCPSWDCASITSTVTGAPSACQSFDEQVAPNVYRNSQNYYWAFLPDHFTWRCINGANEDYQACTASYSAATEQGWSELSAGTTASFTYSFPSGSFDITCTGNSVPSPTGSPISNTAAPTASPETSSNTPSPTVSPQTSSNNNTPSPTASPQTSSNNNTPAPTASPETSGNNTPSPTMPPAPSSGSMLPSLLCSLCITCILIVCL